MTNMSSRVMKYINHVRHVHVMINWKIEKFSINSREKQKKKKKNKRLTDVGGRNWLKYGDKMIKSSCDAFRYRFGVHIAKYRFQMAVPRFVDNEIKYRAFGLVLWGSARSANARNIDGSRCNICGSIAAGISSLYTGLFRYRSRDFVRITFVICTCEPVYAYTGWKEKFSYHRWILHLWFDRNTCKEPQNWTWL